MALISNIYLITEEENTCETNEKEPTFNEEPSPDNDEAETILIGDLCVFDKTMVYHRGLIGKRRKYMQPTSYHLSGLDQIKLVVFQFITGIDGNPNPEKKKTTTRR